MFTGYTHIFWLCEPEHDQQCYKSNADKQCKTCNLQYNLLILSYNDILLSYAKLLCRNVKSICITSFDHQMALTK